MYICKSGSDTLFFQMYITELYDIYWVNFTHVYIPGCLPCNCHPNGSRDMQCDDSGKCPCKLDANNKPQTGGEKCDFCADGLFGLPYKPCESE